MDIHVHLGAKEEVVGDGDALRFGLELARRDQVVSVSAAPLGLPRKLWVESGVAIHVRGEGKAVK